MSRRQEEEIVLGLGTDFSESFGSDLGFGYRFLGVGIDMHVTPSSLGCESCDSIVAVTRKGTDFSESFIYFGYRFLGLTCHAVRTQE